MVVIVCVVLWPYQVRVQMEMGSLLYQAVPSLSCPKGFRLVSLSSSNDPTCVNWPVHTPERLDIALQHLDKSHCGRGWFQARDRRRKRCLVFNSLKFIGPK